MTEPTAPLIIGVPRETHPGERRVAVVPSSVAALKKAGFDVLVESGAGTPAGFPDDRYATQGGTILSNRGELFSRATIIVQVRAAGANPAQFHSDLSRLRSGHTLIATCEPLAEPEPLQEIARTGAACFALELIPRITRAQSMDVLSSMATIAGYKAVLLAAGALPRMFPMLMTAAGTITPAKVFVLGAGVAGLQAVATAKRLGALVRGYDIRPAAKEQVESLGGKFVDLELPAGEAEVSGGYAKEMDEEFYRRQREMMLKVVADSNVVITTAAVPGRKAPVLVTREMVGRMAPGSVVVDLAADKGGNCELTRPGSTVVEEGVTIVGPENVPSTVPYHASEMYSRNVTAFLLHIAKGGAIDLDRDDEIIRETLVTRSGRVVQPKVRELLESSVV